MSKFKCYSFTIALLLGCSTAWAQERILFDFEDRDAGRAWQSVNDGVMGGRSRGTFQINDAKRLEFSGRLSLANNGGFASVRARGASLAMKEGEVVVARVKGDGRTYSFNLYADRNLGGFSFRQSFETKADEWIEVRFPVNEFVATWRGRTYPNEKLNPQNVGGLGFLLGDKKEGPFKLEVDWIKVGPATADSQQVQCDGSYDGHLQGVATDGDSIYWSFTTTLVKSDLSGKVLKKTEVANHHGDLCHVDGKLYVAVNLGAFNDPKGNADSWVNVYDASSLKEVGRHETQEVFHGAGGIGYREGRFYVVGGLPDDMEVNYVYEYSADFEFEKRHVVQSGHTHLGIQTACFAHDRWWFGCYGDPRVLLVTDAGFRLKGRYELDCAYGVERLGKDQLWVAADRLVPDAGHQAMLQAAIPDSKLGYQIESDTTKGKQ